MWDSKSYGGDQGGFFNSPSQYASPTKKEDKTGRRVQNVVPVTIRQVLEGQEAGLKIGNLDVHILTFVALVRRIEVTSTKVSYLLDDCTGGITGVFWLESADGDEEQVIPPIVENTYCRIYGSVRSNQGKKYVFIYRIMNLDDLNDLTRHILEVMYSSLKIQKIGTPVMNTGTFTNNSNSLSNSFVAMPATAQPSGNNNQDLVYNTIMQCSRGEIGAPKGDIIKALTGKMSVKDITNILEFLIVEGHIYTTHDDDHFRCTEN
jgi:replication factor A2